MPGGGVFRREVWLIGTTRVQPFSAVKSVSIQMELIIHGHSGGGTTLKFWAESTCMPCAGAPGQVGLLTASTTR